jgi:predicted dehydrogenase
LIRPRTDAKATHILQAIGASSEDKAKEFAEKHARDTHPPTHGTYAAVYEDHTVDIVYIGLPHVFHKDACLKAISHGKHVLCEKPLTLNSSEATEVFEAAKQKGVFVMEGM